MRMVFYDANDTDDAYHDEANNDDYDNKADADNCSRHANHSYHTINHDGVDDDGTTNA